MVMRLVRDREVRGNGQFTSSSNRTVDRQIDNEMVCESEFDSDETRDASLCDGLGRPAVPRRAEPAASAEPPAASDRADAPAGSHALSDETKRQPTDDPVDLGVLEALLLSTQHPLMPARLADLLELSSTAPLRQAVQGLNDLYAQTKRSFRVEQVAGGYQILTLPEYGEVVKRLHLKDADARLTKAALETLAIIAYKQPILRADIEAIRGVACGETIRSLMDKHLVKIAGRAEEPGRPILYGTTKRFLELFGLNNLKDLPHSQDPTKFATDPM